MRAAVRPCPCHPPTHPPLTTTHHHSPPPPSTTYNYRAPPADETRKLRRVHVCAQLSPNTTTENERGELEKTRGKGRRVECAGHKKPIAPRPRPVSFFRGPQRIADGPIHDFKSIFKDRGEKERETRCESLKTSKTHGRRPLRDVALARLPDARTRQLRVGPARTIEMETNERAKRGD